MRKKPADPANYDFSFLITEDHLEKYRKEDLINFMLEFIQGIDKEISEMKLAILSQARMSAGYFTNSIANNKWAIFILNFNKVWIKVKNRKNFCLKINFALSINNNIKH